MAVSAYAALRSLITVLDRVQHPTACPVSIDSSQIQSLMEKVSYLVDFLENYSYQRSKKMEDVERRITTTLHAAEDMVESYHVANIVLGRLQLPYVVTTNEYQIFSDLQKAIQKMDNIIKVAMGVLEEKKSSHGAKNKRKLDDLREPGRILSMTNRIINNEEYEDAREESLSLTTSSTPISVPAENKIVDDNISIRRGLFSPSSATRAMVGDDEQLVHLMGRLITMDRNSRKIIPVVGMGGIGKSTLALNAYTQPHIMKHFDRRAWVTVSHQYTVKTLICPLLHDIGVKDIDNIAEEDLGDCLYKGLFGIRYLIIVDDIWGREAWDEIRRFLPDNNNGSRILFTTRLSSVARSIGSCDAYEMKLLDVGTSWNLLSATIFGKETVTDCELEKLGKEIAECCKGLPLAIVVIGGLLKRSPKTPESWASIGKDVRSILSKEQDGYCLDVLSFSYNYLPIHLKPCFLYMATFEEDSKIDVSNLIKLWVADGFIRPINNITLEEAALEYVNELIDRNLLMVKKRSSIGKVSRCIVHDLIREFCMGEVRKEKFICHAPDEMLKHSLGFESQRRLVHPISALGEYGPALPLPSSMPLARSIISESKEKFINVDCKLLRVLFFGGLLGGDLHFVNLRYLRCNVGMRSNSHSWISLLRNLETLIVTWIGDSLEDQILPSQIWELRYLRHLQFQHYAWVIFPDPACIQSTCILENLQTLFPIKDFNCTDEVLYRVPNLKVLKVCYDSAYLLDHAKLSRCFNNLARLNKLETLKVIFPSTLVYDDHACVFREPENLMFPRNLRKLTISASKIPWGNMKTVGSLPKLEVLKLYSHAFCGDEWEISEGEFECLKHLSVNECDDLSIWRVNSSALPRLESLQLRFVKLEVVPLALGELASIESIDWHTERLSTVINAKKLLEHAQKHGNDDLFIEVKYFSHFVKGSEEVKKLASDHFRVIYEMPYGHCDMTDAELLGTDKYNEFMDRFEEEYEFGDEWKQYRDEINSEVAVAINQRLMMEFP